MSGTSANVSTSNEHNSVSGVGSQRQLTFGFGEVGRLAHEHLPDSTCGTSPVSSVSTGDLVCVDEVQQLEECNPVTPITAASSVTEGEGSLLLRGAGCL